MKKLLLLITATIMAAVGVQAQHIGCIRVDATTRASYDHLLPPPYDFDAQKTYRVPVVLFSFADQDFSMDDPAAYYDRLFNERGFNERMGPGCVADYLRDQSAGRVNLQFDIYGPVKISAKVNNPKITYRTSDVEMKEAINRLSENAEVDFSVYDWDGEGVANIVLFVAAGYTGNQVKGNLYPNTGYFLKELPGGVDAYFASLTCELWGDDKLCGIGTILHEFCHFLGLPDIYPVTSAANVYSVLDEWDLMDGGNYTNYGWCPPNLSAMERMYLGWASPEELTEAATIEGMKPLSDGGKTYIVRSSDNSDEFYLLENRQQSGWDYGCPGSGLLIYHIDFKMDSWRDNYVNISPTHFLYDIFHADGKDYKAWDPDNNGKDITKWTMEPRLRNRYLSTSSYPYTDPISHVVNNSLTDESSPAATLFQSKPSGTPVLMGKPITNIRMADDGTISFDFMKSKSDDTGIASTIITDEANVVWYSIDGRRLSGKPTTKGLYIYLSKSGTSQKIYLPHGKVRKLY